MMHKIISCSQGVWFWYFTTVSVKGQTAQITLILVNGHADTFRCMCWGFEISEIFVLPKAVKKQILRKSVAICFSTNNIQVTQDNKQISEQMFLW